MSETFVEGKPTGEHWVAGHPHKDSGNGAGQHESHGDKIGDTSPRPPLTAKQQSAKQLLTDWLNTLGLGSLGQKVWNEYLGGTPTAKIMADVRASDAYAHRFPGMAVLAKGGHAISEADYIAKESADMSLMRAYGLPPQMVNNRQELGKLIGAQVSTTELQARLEARKEIVNGLPHEVRDYLASSGINTGDLIGFWENPDIALPVIQQKVAAAKVGGAAAVAGFGALDPTQAAHLAGLGVDWQKALAGFTQAGQLTGLTTALPGQAGSVSRTDLADALVGSDAGASLRVQRESNRRKSQFADAGQVAMTQQGAVGLGVSDQP